MMFYLILQMTLVSDSCRQEPLSSLPTDVCEMSVWNVCKKSPEDCCAMIGQCTDSDYGLTDLDYADNHAQGKSLTDNEFPPVLIILIFDFVKPFPKTSMNGFYPALYSKVHAPHPLLEGHHKVSDLLVSPFFCVPIRFIKGHVSLPVAFFVF